MNIYKFSFVVLISILIFSGCAFCQDNSGDILYINMIKKQRSENQMKSSLPEERNLSGFRLKSSGYTEALTNQSNFQGYQTTVKTKTLKTEKDKVIYTDYNESFSKATPQLILTNTLAAVEYQADKLISIRKNDLPYIAGVTGITVGLLFLDARLDKAVKNELSKSKTFDAVTDFITDFGAENSLYSVAVFAGLSVLTKSNKGVQTSLYAFEAMLNSGMWIRVGKLLAGRERPEASYEYSKHPSGIWKGPINQIINKEKRSVASYDAFPSGHTATIFSVATVFAKQYSDIPIVPVISYTFATIVGISRMYEHAHWASDVFLGAVIGYLCGEATLNFYKQRENYLSKKIKFALKPSVTPQNYGADMELNF
jgi:membrane-associated phospholipid phosphatase